MTQRVHPLRAGLSLLALLLLAVAPRAVLARPATPDEDIAIYKVYLTDQRDGSFVVCWITNLPADGRVEWGAAAPLANTATDAAASATSHRVVIPNAGSLQAGATYSAQARSGGATENNGGDYYVQVTGPTLSLPGAGNTVWGYVYRSDGVTPAANAVVFLRLHDEDTGTGDSQWVTARTDEAGVWYYVLSNVRSRDATEYFAADPGVDRLQMIVRADAGSAVEHAFLLPADFPGGAAQMPSLVLADPSDATRAQVAIALQSGSDVQLTWSYATANIDYEVWQSTQPYADPRSAGTHRIGELERGTAGGLFFSDAGAVGDGAPDFYTVLAYDLAGKPGPISNRIGEFSFTLTKGTN